MSKSDNQGNSAAGVFRQVPELEFEGKSYPVGPVTLEVMGLFESWLWKRDLKTIQACRDVLGLADYSMQMEQWRKGCTLGDWSWDSYPSRLARETSEGSKYLAYLQLQAGLEKRRSEDKGYRASPVTEGLVERIFADQKALADLRTIQEMLADPNPSRPSPEEPAVGQ